MCEGDLCQPLSGPRHLMDEASAPQPQTVNIDPEKEYILEVCGRSGALLDRLELKIGAKGSVGSEPRTVSFGGTGGSPFRCEIPKDKEFIAFVGGLGGHIHQIGVYARPLNTTASQSEEDSSTAESRGSQAQAPVKKEQNMTPQEEAQLKLQQLIKHFFFELQKGFTHSLSFPILLQPP
mmetsp:Transcript_26672/g.41746  ORF Transcript_26672/g.41746 Transcript_26672/m.41746 type:complete len:179 (-) Transcript_26672:1644-2180(-)